MVSLSLLSLLGLVTRDRGTSDLECRVRYLVEALRRTAHECLGSGSVEVRQESFPKVESRKAFLALDNSTALETDTSISPYGPYLVIRKCAPEPVPEPHFRFTEAQTMGSTANREVSEAGSRLIQNPKRNNKPYASRNFAVSLLFSLAMDPQTGSAPMHQGVSHQPHMEPTKSSFPGRRLDFYSHWMRRH